MLRLAVDSFAFRQGEIVTITNKRPESGRFLAVRMVPVEFPDDNYHKLADTDGKPVELAVVTACEIGRDGKWKWVSLSPASKEALASSMVDDCGCEKNVWYYVAIQDAPAEQADSVAVAGADK